MALAASFCTKRRSSSYKPHRRIIKPSCWRNPIVVFLVSFLALGSLRFRVRPKRVASALYQKHLENKKKTKSRSSSSSSSNSSMEYYFRYIQTEEGFTSSGNAFRRYSVVKQPSNKSVSYSTISDTANGMAAVSMEEWLVALAGAPDDSKHGSNFKSKSLSSKTTTLPPVLGDFLRILQTAPYAAYFWETPGVTVHSAAYQPAEFVLVDAPALDRFASSRPDPQAFAAHFARCRGTDTTGAAATYKSSSLVCRFGNLSGDAELVAPMPLRQPPLLHSSSSSSRGSSSVGTTDYLTTYSHLGQFVRKAPIEQQVAVFQKGAETMLHVLANQPKQQQQSSSSPLFVRGSSTTSTAPTATAKYFSTSGMGIAWLHLRVDSTPKYYTYAPYKRSVPPAPSLSPPAPMDAMMQNS